MTARWPRPGVVRHHSTWGEQIGTRIAVGVGLVGIVLIAALMLTMARAGAHDSWISRGALKNPAGEWCCGSEDCGVMISGHVKPVEGGYEVDAVFRIDHLGTVTDDHVREFWPIGETTPSPDGAYWRCKRADGSARCKFVPPPWS